MNSEWSAAQCLRLTSDLLHAGGGKSAPLGAVVNIRRWSPHPLVINRPWSLNPGELGVSIFLVTLFGWVASHVPIAKSPVPTHCLDLFLVDIFCARFDPIRDTPCGFPS